MNVVTKNVVTPCGSGKSKCGYCSGSRSRRSSKGSSKDSSKDSNSTSSSHSYGFLSYGLSLTPLLYVSLLNRGFRRSGHYLYKPTNSTTCCPQHCIRLSVPEWTPRKSERKCANKFKRYLQNAPPQSPTPKGDDDDSHVREALIAYITSSLTSSGIPSSKLTSIPLKKKSPTSYSSSVLNSLKRSTPVDFVTSSSFPSFSFSSYKIIRVSVSNGFINISITPPVDCTPPPPLPPPPSKLTYKLLPSFLSSMDPSVHPLYCSYQSSVHSDPNPYRKSQSDVEDSKVSFDRFLVHNPFSDAENDYENGMPREFEEGEIGTKPNDGCYHLHYVVDGRLVMVSVLDILGDVMSSVYCFYDKELSDTLNLGKLSVVKEVEMCKEWGIGWYYLGFYIESCGKMRYKGEYGRSYVRWKGGWLEFNEEGKKKMKDNESEFWEGEDAPINPSTLSSIANDIPIKLSTSEDTVRLSHLNPRGREIVRPILEEFVEKVGEEIAVECVLKL
ncbi:hypothetical protein TrVE_jg1745 [Triparma verrucosa]|uniref:Arginyl-tRNA--protein transferase 1 n=1 Tax=Triparma verrucosa TaxID=1606542 RepID=A0A9W7C795_9STRA|nr:hypothetical protein TrVE_jg1745 [Triparma verrucosa]